MNGVIEKLLPVGQPTFGFIRGSDGVNYFLLPSNMQVTGPVTFDQLKLGMVVKFESITHPKGPRAIEVIVLVQNHAAEAEEFVRGRE